jgi:hypothetical protein
VQNQQRRREQHEEDEPNDVKQPPLDRIYLNGYTAILWERVAPLELVS